MSEREGEEAIKRVGDKARGEGAKGEGRSWRQVGVRLEVAP